MTDVLFPGFEPPPREPPLSADASRTVRQRLAIAAGAHPLSLVVPLALHPQAPTDATRDDPPGRPFTCGTCTNRVAYGYPKCVADGRRRISHGAATDCRAWWPACTDYDPRTDSPTGGPDA